MLTSLRIQNFRSICDATVKLGQVNLFIGPNNSGKSNFMKGIQLLAFSISEYPANTLSYEKFLTILPRSLNRKKQQIRIATETEKHPNSTVSLFIGNGLDIINGDEVEVYSSEVSILPNIESPHLPPHKYSYYDEDEYNFPIEMRYLKRILSPLYMYKLEPASFELSTGISNQEFLTSNGSNIVNFLYNLGQNHKSKYRNLENDFAHCIGNLVSVSTPADPVEVGKLKLKFFDQNDISYWAEEVSEGVLYFLALLCIIHQPNPPKLLLLEEPEKGIHPRRIKEVIDFIFELARLRDIQIILTSHSPYVVDHFADTPECISVFDRENGETVIRNAGDIITETNARLEAQGKKPIRYTDSLGEHWVSGFLGGVPA